MPYAEGRIYNDADSHIMELPEWLFAYADADVRAKMLPPYYGATGRMREALGKKRDADHWRKVDVSANLMNLKGWDAYGASNARERTHALDMLGFNCQLVFPSIALSQFWGLFNQQQRDPHLLYGGARALNHAMVDFCAHDKRLLPVGFVPLDVPERAEKTIEEAVRMGCAGLWIPAMPPGDVSPTHPRYNGVWARFQDLNVPFLLHVGANPLVVSRAYVNNGLPTSDFLGGGETVSAKDYMVLHTVSEVFLSALVLDGVFERFPRLRGGCIEEGALWVVPWLKRLDAAQETFAWTEPHMAALPLRASEYVHRQLRFTPHPTEAVGWMIEQAGEDLFMFSSDYPHIEGGRHPLKRFEMAMPGISEAAKERFYAQNFVDLVGKGAVASAASQ